MNPAELYQYRKMNHICVKCGYEEAKPGKTRCIRCAQIDAVRQAQYEASYSTERKAERREYSRNWIKSHPEKNREYQKRFRQKEALLDYEW